jgi:hypothetical protein
MQIQRHCERGTALAVSGCMNTEVRSVHLRRFLVVPALVLAVYFPARPSILSWTAHDPVDSLWENPANLESANLFGGPWGLDAAPDPTGTFTFLRPKYRGIDPGVIVSDPSGREWHVKQHARNRAGIASPVEVVVSRVLSAVGYHQPPVYYLSSFKMVRRSPKTVESTEASGRFRLQMSSIRDVGPWSWQRNPFVGTRPHQGLLVTLLLLGATDLKDANNSLYRVSIDGEIEHWYVVRDPGAALGEDPRVAARSDDAVARYERSRFIAGVSDGFVEFANKSSYERLFQRRITVDDARWAGQLLTRLTDRQWHDAFRAGGYAPDVADRFIRKIHSNIKEVQSLGGVEGP